METTFNMLGSEISGPYKTITCVAEAHMANKAFIKITYFLLSPSYQ